MQAVRIKRFGGPEVLVVEDDPIPEPKEDEALVKVRAASVNPVDYKIRSGKYPAVKESDLPITLGRDIAGAVEKCGKAFGLSPGNEIMAMLGSGRGGYAEYAIVKRSEAAAKPDRLNEADAAAVPLAALTAWQGLFDQGGLQKGQRVLIHGGAGGVGHFAIQFAKAKGAYVVTTAAREDLNFVRGLGADEAIDYKAQKFEDEVKDIDLVFDLIGGETQARSFRVLKPGGMLVSTLQKPDKETLSQHGVRGTNYKARPDREQLTEIGSLIASGKVHPVVSKRFPLEKAAEAQKELETSHIRGKVVLICSS